MKRMIETLERRCFLDGTLDPNFGFDGVVLDTFRNTNDAVSMAFMDDGRHVVVGTTEFSGRGKDIFVARYTAGGALDSTFGVGGVTYLDLGADDVPTAVKVQRGNGKIVAAGTTGNASGTLGDAWVARWTSDGKPDLTLNKTGYRVVDFGGIDAVSGLLLDRGDMDSGTSDGDSDILIAGASANLPKMTSGIGMAKLLSTGALDYDFGDGTGVVVSTPGPGKFEGATSLSKFGNRYLVSGFQVTPGGAQTSRFMVASVDECGDLDMTFGTAAGRAFANFGGNLELAMEARYDKYSDRIYVVGMSGDGLPADPVPGLPRLSVGGVASSSRFAIARFLTDGQRDQSFNGTGLSTIEFPDYKAAATGMAIQGDGRVIVGGGAQSLSTGASDFAFARLGTDGMLDPTFRGGGRYLEDLGANEGAFRLFQRRGDAGAFYAIGHSKFDSTNGRLALLRYMVASSPFGVSPAVLGISNIQRVAAPVSGTLDFRVRLMNAPTTPVTVNYATRNGLSLAGVDYTATFGTLTFNPGERSKTISVPYLDSDNGATPGSFYLDLSSPSSGAVIANPTARASLQYLAPNLNKLRVQSVTPVGFPKTIVGGQPAAGQPTARVTLKNFGTTPLRGKQVLSVYGSTDRRLETKTDKLMGQLTIDVDIPAGKTKSFNVPVTFPPNLVRDTQFHLLATTAKGVGVTKPATNVARADSEFLVTTPTVTLTGTTKARPAVTFKFGQKGNVSFPLTNNGTAPAAGVATIVLALSTDRTLANARYIYFPKNVPINIAQGQTQTLSMSITAPAKNTGLSPGKYFMLVQLTGTKLKFKNTTDGSIVATIPFTLK